MIPIKFPEADHHLLRPEDMTDEQCTSLDAFWTGDNFISCWKVSWKERLKILFGKPIWLWMRSRRHPPVALEIDYPFRNRI